MTNHNEHTNGPTMAREAPPEETLNLGLEGPFIERQQYQAAQSIVDKFMTIRPVPEEMWLSAGMPLPVAALHRRVQDNEIYVLFGVQDVEGDIVKSMASWAGHDRKAREDAKQVAVGLRIGPAEYGSEKTREAFKEVNGKAPTPN